MSAKGQKADIAPLIALGLQHRTSDGDTLPNTLCKVGRWLEFFGLMMGQEANGDIAAK
jgi:hypothetical protein